jgi:hypothetical protein
MDRRSRSGFKSGLVAMSAQGPRSKLAAESGTDVVGVLCGKIGLLVVVDANCSGAPLKDGEGELEHPSATMPMQVSATSVRRTLNASWPSDISTAFHSFVVTGAFGDTRKPPEMGERSQWYQAVPSAGMSTVPDRWDAVTPLRPVRSPPCRGHCRIHLCRSQQAIPLEASTCGAARIHLSWICFGYLSESQRLSPANAPSGRYCSISSPSKPKRGGRRRGGSVVPCLHARAL